MSKKYWLVKSEPEEFSFNDLKESKNKTTYWDGIRKNAVIKFTSLSKQETNNVYSTIFL